MRERGSRGAVEVSEAASEADLERHAKRCVAALDGFNVHAGVRVAEHDRDGLERLCRSMGRPAVAAGRVIRLDDGTVAYRVKHPRGSKTHRVMTPMEFLAALAALVPPPRFPLVRYHGVPAPNSPWRAAVVPAVSRTGATRGRCPAGRPATGDGAAEAPSVPVRASHRIDWATLLKRVWKIDALDCARCHGRMKVLAAVTERAAIVRILENLGAPTAVPRFARWIRAGPDW